MHISLFGDYRFIECQEQVDFHLLMANTRNLHEHTVNRRRYVTEKKFIYSLNCNWFLLDDNQPFPEFSNPKDETVTSEVLCTES